MIYHTHKQSAIDQNDWLSKTYTCTLSKFDKKKYLKLSFLKKKYDKICENNNWSNNKTHSIHYYHFVLISTYMFMVNLYITKKKTRWAYSGAKYYSKV